MNGESSDIFSYLKTLCTQANSYNVMNWVVVIIKYTNLHCESREQYYLDNGNDTKYDN